MNRRDFVAGIFGILPSAMCYKRIWHEVAKTPPILYGATLAPAPGTVGYYKVLWQVDKWPTMFQDVQFEHVDITTGEVFEINKDFNENNFKINPKWEAIEKKTYIIT